MNFTVKHQAGRYDIVSYGKILASFDTEEAAQDAAEKLKAEYERVLSFL